MTCYTCTDTGEILSLAELKEDYRAFAASNADEGCAIAEYGLDSAFHWHMVDALKRFTTLEAQDDADLAKSGDARPMTVPKD